ncbi:hypothetical protein Pcinc_005677 [Petrolisthes cinctipes]|uniref:DDE Tnp4 domain-containing protein n=1 Tax=Petrolisthes cinctipes TaxID=88211 RepID=A0AAE1GC52_PETCI|nr:hypothetical protein Pcinc_005677 [Petrolisthes cinctipes]
MLIGDTRGPTQASISRIFTRITNIMSTKAAEEINMPSTPQQLSTSAQAFSSVTNFPPVIEAIDGTHVAIKAPSIDEAMYCDSGYPLEPFLMTPVTNPTNEAEELYYRALVRTRVIVELTLGVVKNCFRCIHRFGGELQYTPLRSAKIVSVCLLLHNRCVSRSIPDPNNHLPEEDMPIEAHVVGAGDRGGTGRQTRDEIIPEFYGRKGV